MLEKHPFEIFVPKKTQYLFLGSFVAKPSSGYDWFFGSKRSQFWPILQEVYGLTLQTKEQKQKLFTQLALAITDIILECDRKANNSLDSSLANLVFNTEAIIEILEVNPIKKIYFSSRFAENLFKKYFKDLITKYPKIELITLPSPSPRYATMSKQEKLARYKILLPKLN